MLKIRDLFDLSHTLAGEYLVALDYPWEAIRGIRGMIPALGTKLGPDYIPMGEEIWVHKTAVVSPTAHLQGPCIIGARSEVRHCAFLRGSVLVGEGCVVGNSTEVKNSILFDGVQVPHFNYVGDSILGYKAHLGAGAVTSNIKSDRSPVHIHAPWGDIPTGLKKLGAMVGDYAEVGCSSVLNPGTIVGRRVVIYPLSSVRGTVQENCIYKSAGVTVERR